MCTLNIIHRDRDRDNMKKNNIIGRWQVTSYSLSTNEWIGKRFTSKQCQQLEKTQRTLNVKVFNMT